MPPRTVRQGPGGLELRLGFGHGRGGIAIAVVVVGDRKVIEPRIRAPLAPVQLGLSVVARPASFRLVLLTFLIFAGIVALGRDERLWLRDRGDPPDLLLRQSQIQRTETYILEDRG